MSSYFKQLVSRRIVDIVKSRVKYPVQNESFMVNEISQAIALRKPKSKKSLIIGQSRFQLLLTSPDILKASLPENFQQKGAVLQPKDFLDGLITGFSPLQTHLVRGKRDPLLIMIDVDKFELKKHALNQIWKERECYGCMSVHDELHGNRHTVFIECPSVSRFGPFHCIDLYSAIIGNALANIYEAAGCKVIKCHYICDYSLPFACLYQGLKNENTEEFKRNPVPHFNQIYQEMHQESQNKKWQAYDLVRKLQEEARNENESVMVIRDIIITENKKMFERFGIKFTHTEWESMYERQNQHRQITGERGIIALKDRYKKYQFDMMIYAGFYTISNRKMYLNGSSKLYSQLYDIHPKDQVTIVGRTFEQDIVSKQNKSVKEYLDITKNRVASALKYREYWKDLGKIENGEEVIEVIASTCIVIQTILSTDRYNQKIGIYQIIENGLFLQYVHNRLSKLLRFNADVNIDQLLEVSDDIVKSFQEAESYNLILLMCKFEEEIKGSVIKTQPLFIAKYLLELASCINECLDRLTVENQPDVVVFARLLLFTCAKIVFSNGFRLLGIKTFEKKLD